MTKQLLALLLLVTSGISGWATTLTGRFTTADGSGVNGKIIFVLSQPTTDTQHNVSLAVTPVQFDLNNGNIQSGAYLVGNDQMSPTGTVYMAYVFDAFGTLVRQGPLSITGTTEDVGAAIQLNVTTSNVAFATPLTANGNIPFSGNNTASGNWTQTGGIVDYTGGLITRPFASSLFVNFPATCNPLSDMRVRADPAVTGQWLYGCNASGNGWDLLSGAGGASTSVANTWTDTQTMQPATDVPPLIARAGVGGGSADISQWKKNDGTKIAWFDSNGALNLGLNTFFNGGIQYCTEIADPANPAAGIQVWWCSASSHLMRCKTSTGTDCNPSTSGAQLNATQTFTRKQTIQEQASDVQSLIVKQSSVASPTANIFEVQDQGGVVKFKVDSSGNVTIGTGSTGQVTSVAKYCFTGSFCWLHGAGAPVGACTTGSLYSNDTGTTGATLYACEATAWAAK